MKEQSQPHHASIGDVIEHDLMPGFPMRIVGVDACETDSTRSAEHPMYMVRDPAGKPDWLCAYDVHAAPSSGAGRDI